MYAVKLLRLGYRLGAGVRAEFRCHAQKHDVSLVGDANVCTDHDLGELDHAPLMSHETGLSTKSAYPVA